MTSAHGILVKDEYNSKTGTYALSVRHPGEMPPTPSPDEAVDNQASGGDGQVGNGGGPNTQLLAALIAATATVLAAWLSARPRLRKRRRRASASPAERGPGQGSERSA
ncbi:hypothetical protein DAT35_29500 [Vitiosangium sp. GDMCC 1.1324]|nr:hypothetical protein DAT35_29500 [Vitiosangium sp. GDMCC 1.1324]